MKTNKSFIFLLITLSFCFLFLPQFSFASTTRSIAGSVISASSGEPLVSANISIKSQVVNGKEIPLIDPQGAASDLAGDYFIINVRPGTYIVECIYIGCQNLVKSEVVLYFDN